VDDLIENETGCYRRFTGDNFDELAALMDAHPLCLEVQRSEHYPDLVLFATMAPMNGVYLRELRVGDWLLITHDGYIEEYVGSPAA
jgi:hypothetical protein